MRALAFDGERLALRELPVPRRRPGEALVRVSLAGICNTDLEILRGYMGFNGVLGHEFVGVVQAATDRRLIGRRVVGEINAACGRCAACRAGRERHCPRRTVLGIQGRDGAFAEYLTLPERNLHALPAALSDEVAVFVEPLAAACEILEQVRVEPSCRALVIGDGKLGWLVAQVLALAGANVTLLGKHPENFGRVRCPRLRKLALSDFTPRPVYDLTVEASGVPAGWDLARRSTRPRGTLVLKSTYAGAFEFNPAPLVIHEINVVGSRCGPFKPALRLLRDNGLNVRSLVDGCYPLQRWSEAFTAAQRPGALKVLLRIAP